MKLYPFFLIALAALAGDFAPLPARADDASCKPITDAEAKLANGAKLSARRGNMFCGIEVVGYDSPGDNSVTGDRGETLAKKLGAPCNKLFASH